MKKIICIALLVCILAITCTSCESEQDNSTTIFVRNNISTQEKQYEIEYGTKPHIDIPDYGDFICTGIYAEPDGKGTMYFDAHGDATEEWQSGFPVTMYAQYATRKHTATSDRDFPIGMLGMSLMATNPIKFHISSEFTSLLQKFPKADVKITVIYQTSFDANSSLSTFISNMPNESNIAIDAHITSEASETIVIEKTVKSSSIAGNAVSAAFGASIYISVTAEPSGFVSFSGRDGITYMSCELEISNI